VACRGTRGKLFEKHDEIRQKIYQRFRASKVVLMSIGRTGEKRNGAVAEGAINSGGRERGTALTSCFKKKNSIK